MSIADIKGKPVRIRPEGSVERRNAIRRESHVHRIEAEFDEMPGLALTVRQASRLLGVDHAASARILERLAGEGKLRCLGQHVYVRADRRARAI